MMPERTPPPDDPDRDPDRTPRALWPDALAALFGLVALGVVLYTPLGLGTAVAVALCALIALRANR